MDRVEIVDENLRRRISRADLPAPRTAIDPDDAGLTRGDLIGLFRAQAVSRQLDRLARRLRAIGQGFYTIGSSGHEAMAAVAAACRPDDMAFLHYRDAAFQVMRAQQVPGGTPVEDMVASFASSVDDPISGGRHKVLGSRSLMIPPQTSTIASHLPKAVGAAYSIGLIKRNRPEHAVLADDGVVICSFGDASVNHSTAQGAFNTAGWTSYQGVPLPLVFVCEDNGLGISVRTPPGWVESAMAGRAGLDYVAADGLDLVDTYDVMRRTVESVRRTRAPAFVHLRCVRLYGHAGADAQIGYLTAEEIEAAEADDPLLHGARRLLDAGMAPLEILAIYDDAEADVERAAERIVERPRLTTAADVMASIVPPKRIVAPAARPSAERRDEMFGAAERSAMSKPQPMARLINHALTDLMLEHPEIVIAGQDVGTKGGVYGVTLRLRERFGKTRVIDTLLDEQSILGLAIGMAHNGYLPIPEIQFLAYLHNAEDQLRGEAATLSFFSDGQFTNPMVVRVPGLGYQRGFGGHFHNDNSLAVLRDVPGLVIACPSDGLEAALMLRESVRLAREEQRVVVFVEPIAAYMTRDLHQDGDGLWMHRYPEPDGLVAAPLGTVAMHGDGTDVAIVSYGNGVRLSRQAARVLAEHGIAARVVDLRWIAPVPDDALLRAAAPCDHVLVVDECRRTGSQSEALMTLFTERGRVPVARVTADDSFIATGPAFDATLPSRDDVVDAALLLTGHRR